MQHTTTSSDSLRLSLVAIGALAGLVFWVLLESSFGLIDNPRILVFLSAWSFGFFSNLLLMTGRMSIQRSIMASGIVAFLAAGLLIWASFRFVEFDGMSQNITPFLAYTVLVFLPMPFLLSQVTHKGGMRNYAALFDNAWSIFVRAITAWIFCGVFWLVVLLSHLLLQLVGFNYVQELIQNMWFSLPLSGAVIGIALAVLVELDHVVATLRRLALHLLRLLLPLVSFVITLFLLLVPFRGFSEVFGELSAAATMLAMAVGGIVLITSGVDARDKDAATSLVIIVSARALSFLLPLITGIAVWALWLRVAQYGWTPARFAALWAAIVVMAYAVSYAWAAVASKNWQQKIRRANRHLAMGLIGLAVLWQTPALNAERISANSHVARFISGDISLDDLDLRRLSEYWGRAGSLGVDRLRAVETHPDLDALKEKIARFDGDQSDQSDQTEPRTDEDYFLLKQRVVEIMPILPPDQNETKSGIAQAIDLLSHFEVEELAVSCEPGAVVSTNASEKSCVAIIADHGDGRETLVIMWRGAFSYGVEVRMFEKTPDRSEYFQRDPYILSGRAPEDWNFNDVMDQIEKGAFSSDLITVPGFSIGGVQILSLP